MRSLSQLEHLPFVVFWYPLQRICRAKELAKSLWKEGQWKHNVMYLPSSSGNTCTQSRSVDAEQLVAAVEAGAQEHQVRMGSWAPEDNDTGTRLHHIRRHVPDVADPAGSTDPTACLCLGTVPFHHKAFCRRTAFDLVRLELAAVGTAKSAERIHPPADSDSAGRIRGDESQTSEDSYRKAADLASRTHYSVGPVHLSRRLWGRLWDRLLDLGGTSVLPRIFDLGSAGRGDSRWPELGPGPGPGSEPMGASPCWWSLMAARDTAIASLRRHPEAKDSWTVQVRLSKGNLYPPS